MKILRMNLLQIIFIRKSHFTKSELKRRRKTRKGDGPWGSWSSSDDETSQASETQKEDQDIFVHALVEDNLDSNR